MPYRDKHKNQLKALLETITYEGNPLSVATKYVTTADTDPYLFITSAEVESLARTDNVTFEPHYGYNIVCAFSIDENGMDESRMDDVEELIMRKLMSNQAAFCLFEPVAANRWRNMKLLSVSEPFSNDDPEVIDSSVYKTFKVQIWERFRA